LIDKERSEYERTRSKIASLARWKIEDYNRSLLGLEIGGEGKANGGEAGGDDADTNHDAQSHSQF